MSQWIDDQAEESDHDEDDIPVSKRARIASDDDEDDEEEDESKIAEEMQGFVVTGDEEDEEGEGNDEEKKSDSEVEDEEADLEEDDEDLLQENLGIAVKKQKRRIVVDSDDENEKADLEKQLFEGSEEVEERVRPGAAVSRRNEYEEEDRASVESGEESGIDDFIEDDDEEGFRPRDKKKKRRQRIPISDSALQEAREIFGDAVDLEDLYAEEEEGEVEEGEPDEYEEEGEGEGAERSVSERRPKKTKKKVIKKSLLDHLDPSELDRGFLSEIDKKIQLEDKPERFQLRSIPVAEASKDELLAESTWIYKYAFEATPVSMQDDDHDIKKDPALVNNINDALNFIRNQDFEVPFIAFYRKEYVDKPGLSIGDLWKVYQWDEKWCQLQARKKNMANLFRRMQTFQYEFILQDASKPLTDDVRILTDEDIEEIWKVETPEDLHDVYLHFLLYYGRDIPKMVEWERLKEAQEKSSEEEQIRILKQASRRDKYSICVDAGLCGLANKFGLTPKQFAENMEASYARNPVEQYPLGPNEIAQQYINERLNAPELVLKGAAYVVGMQLAREPMVRRCVREEYRSNAVVCVKPTKKGLKEIDENHPLYGQRYLKNKPVKDVEKDQYLKYIQAESLGLIKVTISMDPIGGPNRSYLKELKSRQIYYLDEYNTIANEWNELREKALEVCLENLYQFLEKELRAKLAQEARDCVLKECAYKMYDWLRIGPYIPEQQSEEDDDEPTKCRVLGISYPREIDQASFCALVNGDGEVTDYLRLVHLIRSRNFDKAELKAKDMETLRQFLINKRPHVIAIAGESLEAAMIKDDIESLLISMDQENQLNRPIAVEIIDSDLAKVYMNSRKAQMDFPDYPSLLRQAISLARRMQDPLLEFCQMCNPDEDILCVKCHPLQDLISKESLLNSLQLEFINRVNEVGVDINRCLEHPHTAYCLQFVCGLGPRKAAYLLKLLTQTDNLLENRTKLVTVCHMGPKVFMNCAGFIKIDTIKVAEKTDAYVEVLDGTRVHPETYEWARKMAVDALEYDDTGEDANPASALEEILETPERLKDLDLDAFAEELQRQGFGNKNITLYDIRAELTHRYKDLRTPYAPPTKTDLFNMLTKETPATFNNGKLVLGRVLKIVYRKPRPDELEQTNPTRNDETGMWQCPLCLKNDFSELSEVWSHFDTNKCPGHAIGVRVKLENGILGFIPTKLISDKHVDNPAERVKIGMPLYCRVMKVDPDRFTAELSCQSSALRDDSNQFKPRYDDYYDREAEMQDTQKEKNIVQQKQKQQYVKRVIAHPLFQNCSFKEAELLLSNKDQGDVIIRPSSKGEKHLTVTWKVTEGVYQHIDVREENKENAFSLGHTLFIGDEIFEDLDEIVARYVKPMADNAREILCYKYFRDADSRRRDEIEKMLVEEKQKNPNRISYMFTASKEMPGKFMLSYLPRNKARHEFVTVMPNGFRFRGIVHRSLNQLLAWFKEHFRDPIPGMTPISATPVDQASHRGFTPRFDTASRLGATPAQIGQAQAAWSASQNRNYAAQAYMAPVASVYAVPHALRKNALLNTPSSSYSTENRVNWPSAGMNLSNTGSTREASWSDNRAEIWTDNRQTWNDSRETWDTNSRENAAWSDNRSDWDGGERDSWTGGRGKWSGNRRGGGSTGGWGEKRGGWNRKRGGEWNENRSSNWRRY